MKRMGKLLSLLDQMMEERRSKSTDLRSPLDGNKTRVSREKELKKIQIEYAALNMANTIIANSVERCWKIK
jgi:hypothetical protein